VPRRHLILATLALAACNTTDPGLTFYTTADTDPLVASSLEFVPPAQPLNHKVVSKPADEIKSHGGFVIAVVTRTDCTDCYRLDGDGERFTVTGGMPLGVQYGVAHVMELLGYRFLHPWKTLAPATLAKTDTSALGKEYAPEITGKRGLHLHTLHTIEALWDFWVPSDNGLTGARRTIDFLIKNRGNYIQWAGLNDILNDAQKQTAWQAHTKKIVDYAHGRGVKTGIGIELFGSGDLQNAYELVDGMTADPAELQRRFHLVNDGIGFDTCNLSFGEFFNEPPQTFIDSVNAAYDALQVAAPGMEMAATVHMGNYANLQVSYMGQTLQYYFLVQFANQAIVPWIHSVMYFDLYEDAGGAYDYDLFTDHRTFLESRLKAGQPAGYFPESAYWVAFDDSVPTYLPLYLRSRWTDLHNLKAAGPLQHYVEFSSGFEWGYWQQDRATLRWAFHLDDTWDAPIADAFKVYGDKGAKLADLIRRYGETEHHALIEERLAAYIAGRDQLIDYGRGSGIVSQPDRVDVPDLPNLDGGTLGSFDSTRLQPLEQFSTDLEAYATEIDGLGLDTSEGFQAEAIDGVEVTALRARFVASVYRAVMNHLNGTDPQPMLDQAQQKLDAAQAVVQRRHRALFDPDPLLLIHQPVNPTLYQYGYLYEADTLCYWKRELAQAKNITVQAGMAVPGCVL
jgi:hypothetical protein